MFTLLQFSENDKRFIFVLLLAVILVFVLISYIGSLIIRIMKVQGQRMEGYVSPVIKLRIITDKKKFKRYATKKNWIIFYKQARIPVLILLVSFLILVIRNSFLGWNYNPFHEVEILEVAGEPYEHLISFSSILFILKWDIVIKEGILNIPPIECVHTPEFLVQAIPSYLFVTGLVVGGIWYIIVIQSFIARQFHIQKIIDKHISDTLEGYNQGTEIARDAINNIQQQQQQQQINSQVNNQNGKIDL